MRDKVSKGVSARCIQIMRKIYKEVEDGLKHTLILMMAPPGVGKSFLAKKFADSHDDTIIISRDSIRFDMLKDGDDYFKYEKEVEKKYYDAVSRALEVHKYVIADATHITLRSRRKFFHNVKIGSDVRTIGIWLDTPMKIAMKQNNMRTGRAHVSEEVIRNMYKKKVSPRENEPFDEVIFVSRDVDMAIGSKHINITNVMDKLNEI